jgi:hypothetical protein
VLTHAFWIIAAAAFWIIAAAGVLAALYYCLEAGVRNGDHPGDAMVTALLKARWPAFIAGEEGSLIMVG